jgi:peptidyl-prolyl cis-trans isomerase B (cyclophilin B)
MQIFKLSTARTHRFYCFSLGILLCFLGETAMSAGEPMVRLQTSMGAIAIQLDREKAPETVANFLEYAREGFYDSTLFHRVIDGFMVQGGGFGPGMRKKSARPPIENEADNGLSNKAGTIAMARTADPHSATSQFYINVADNPFLDFKAPTREGWGYCVFGEVVEGQEVLDRIRQTPTTSRGGHENVPIDDVVLEHVEIVE